VLAVRYELDCKYCYNGPPRPVMRIALLCFSFTHWIGDSVLPTFGLYSVEEKTYLAPIGNETPDPRVSRPHDHLQYSPVQ
jgi:hypothetical protein